MDISNYTIRLSSGKFSTLDKAYIQVIKDYINNDEIWIKRWETYELVIQELLKFNDESVFEELKYYVTGGENINEVLLNILNHQNDSTITVRAAKIKIQEYADIDWLKKYIE